MGKKNNFNENKRHIKGVHVIFPALRTSIENHSTFHQFKHVIFKYLNSFQSSECLNAQTDRKRTALGINFRFVEKCPNMSASAVVRRVAALSGASAVGLGAYGAHGESRTHARTRPLRSCLANDYRTRRSSLHSQISRFKVSFLATQ